MSSSDDTESSSSFYIGNLHKRILEFVRSCNLKQFNNLFDKKSNQSLLDTELDRDWRKIKDDLIDTIDVSASEVTTHYTYILKCFIEHNLKLPSLLNEILFSCCEPIFMYRIFNANLVSINDSFKVLLNNFMFVGIADVDETTPAYEIIMSLTILVYKAKCLKFRNEIIRSVNDSFLEFIFYEKYSDEVRKIAIRKFIEALILNGIFTVKDLSNFMVQTDRDNGNATTDADESGESMFSSSSESDEDDELMDIGPAIAVIAAGAIHAIPNREGAPARVDRTVTVAEKLLLSNSSFFNDIYPLSLKNLCRIKVKNSLKEYSERSVDTLQLPAVVHKFLLFEDQVVDILKLSKNYNHVQ